jgi:outer membrane immunogenic protein
MKQQWLAGAALAALSIGSAVAADMPVKAIPPGCPGCNWNGYYVGVNLGGGFAQGRGNDGISLTPAGTFAAVAPGVANPISNTSYSESPAGFLGGGQIGYNWQMGHVVLGAEADWDLASQRDSVQVDNFIASSVVVAPASYGYSDQEKIKWLSTVRARIGWANGWTLAYVTGGPAWGRIDSNYTFATFGSGIFAPAAGAANFSTTKTGFAIGSGVETSLGWMGANHWSAKIEYLYVDLGTVRNAFSVPNGGVVGSTYGIASSAQIHDHLVRVGLNYRFGGDQFAPPPTPGPCPTCDWKGFYVGLNEATAVAHNRSHDTDSLIPPTANGAAVTNPLTDVWHTDAPVGYAGGGQVGFNWQSGSIVLGAEGDWDLVRQRDTFSNTNFVASTTVVAPTAVSMTDTQKLDWLATARARVGWTENCFLWYVTGGAAWGRVESNYTFASNQLLGAGVLGPALGAFNTSATKAGWTVGAGVETPLTFLGLSSRWTSKFEYLYVDLGSISNSFAVPVTGATGSHVVSSTSEIRDNIVRFGVNYRFGG